MEAYGIGKVETKGLSAQFTYSVVTEHITIEGVPKTDGRCVVHLPYCGEFIRSVSFSEDVTDLAGMCYDAEWKMADAPKNTESVLTIEPFGIPISINPFDGSFDPTGSAVMFSYKTLPKLSVKYILVGSFIHTSPSSNARQMLSMVPTPFHGNSIIDGREYLRTVLIAPHYYGVYATLSSDNSDFSESNISHHTNVNYDSVRNPYTVVSEFKLEEKTNPHEQLIVKSKETKVQCHFL
jgi:hypothetical protein